MNNCYASVGFLGKSSDIELLERILLYNYETISKFNYIVVKNTCNPEMDVYYDAYNDIWKKIFGNNVIILPKTKNRGHTFGTLDADNEIVNYSKSLPIKYIFKTASDILISPKILNYPLSDDYQFYFLQGIGYTGLEKFGFDTSTYLNQYLNIENLYPQTNFYIIDKNINTLNDVNLINLNYDYCMSIPNYNGKAWEYVKDFSCESLLRDCVQRNSLKYKHLISDETFVKLVEYIKTHKVCDCSHKNIYIEELGICHFAFPNDPCIII